jgi:hypothetical protein
MQCAHEWFSHVLPAVFAVGRTRSFINKQSREAIPGFFITEFFISGEQSLKFESQNIMSGRVNPA